MAVLTFPYPQAPPPSPFLASEGAGWRYDHPQTTVQAEIAAGVLTTPVPRAAFHAQELREALALPPEFDDAWRAAHVGADGPRLARGLGLAWWRYTMARPAIRTAWPSIDIVVPDLLLFVSRGSRGSRGSGRSVTTVLVWPEDVRALVVPEAAEHVVVRPDPLKVAGTGPRVLIPRAIVGQAIGERSTAYQAPVPYRVYRGGEAHGFILAALRRAAGEPASAFHAVRADRVIDAD